MSFGRRMGRRQSCSDRDRRFNEKMSLVRRGRGGTSRQVVYSPKSDQGLCDNDRVRQPARRNRHGKPGDDGSDRCADAVKKQQTAQRGYQLLFRNHVAHMRNNDAVDRNDRRTE